MAEPHLLRQRAKGRRSRDKLDLSDASVHGCLRPSCAGTEYGTPTLGSPNSAAQLRPRPHANQIPELWKRQVFVVGNGKHHRYRMHSILHALQGSCLSAMPQGSLVVIAIVLSHFQPFPIILKDYICRLPTTQVMATICCF